MIPLLYMTYEKTKPVENISGIFLSTNADHLELDLKNVLETFCRAGEDGFGAFFEDGALDEVGVSEHEIDPLSAGELLVGELELFVDVFVLPDELGCGDAHLFD